MRTVEQIELERLAEQARLDGLKSAESRNRWGQFATPPALALDITREAKRRVRRRGGRPVRFLDPAIGTGSFFSSFLSVFPPSQVGASLGIELDERFADAAQRLWTGTPLNVRNDDFTQISPPEDSRFDLVIANPPYVRHHYIGKNEKTRLRKEVHLRTGIEVSGLAGLYAYFLLLTDTWLEQDALSLWLIPSEFMDVNYGSSLKEYLTEHVTLHRIHRFLPSDVQFSDALVSSAILIFSKKKPRRQHEVAMTLGGPLAKPERTHHVRLTELCGARKWTRYAFGDTGSSRNLDEFLLGDLFRITRGIATGSNSFFIVPRDETSSLQIPERFLKPILPSPRFVDTLVIESESDGYPCLPKQLCLLDCKLTEAEIKGSHEQLWRYLQRGKAKGIHTGYLASRRYPWYAQEQRPPAPFLCTYMGRKGQNGSPFRFLWNKSRATAANVYLLLYPKPPLQAACDANPDSYQMIFSFLQSIKPSQFLNEGRVYGGGLHKIEPRELARVSVEELLSQLGGIEFHRQLSLFDSAACVV